MRRLARSSSTVRAAPRHATANRPNHARSQPTAFAIVLSLTPNVQRDAGLDQVYLYHEFSSGVRDDRRESTTACGPRGKGDALVVWKLDRLGRNDGTALRPQGSERSVPSTPQRRRAAALRLAHQAHPLAVATDHRLDEDRKADRAQCPAVQAAPVRRGPLECTSSLALSAKATPGRRSAESPGPVPGRCRTPCPRTESPRRSP